MSDPAETETDDQEPAEGSDADLVEDYVEEFDTIIQAVQEERALNLADRRFASIAGAQWEGDWADQFANSIMVEVNKTAAGVEKIIGDYRNNRITVEFRAVGDTGDDDTADMLNGVFRADVYNSKGQQAFDNAFEEGVQGGIGAFRLTTDYADPYDPESDEQRICFEAIVDADQSVFWDPNAKLYDKSDAKFCYVLTAMSRGAFIKAYGEDKIQDWPQAIPKPYYDWFTPEVVRIAERYEVREATISLGVYEHKLTGEEQRIPVATMTADEKAALLTEGWKLARTRKVKQRQVWKIVMSGQDVLEPEKRVAGSEIPVIPFYGKRWFIDNMERTRGHVRLAKDPQRIYNAQISKLTETASLSPIERVIVTPEQMLGHSTEWAEANIKRAAYSVLNMVTDVNGQPVIGPIGKVSPPQLPPVLAALIQVTAADIAELTSADDGADQAQPNISAAAMDIAATRVDAKSAIYIDNFRQSFQRCGEVYQSMAEEIYVEEGRKLETLGENGEIGTATLSEGFTDEQSRYRIRHDLSKGKYKVISDVSEATTTRRDKTVKTLVNMAQIAQAADPQLATVCLSTALVNMDGEGMSDLQAYVRKQLVAQGVVTPTREEADQLAQEKAQAAQKPPSPEQQEMQAKAQALAAGAQKDAALAGKAQADTHLATAKATQILETTQASHDQARTAHTERKVGVLAKVAGMMGLGQRAQG